MYELILSHNRDELNIFALQDMSLPEKNKRLIRKAAQKRFYTMVLGTSAAHGIPFNFEGFKLHNSRCTKCFISLIYQIYF